MARTVLQATPTWLAPCPAFSKGRGTVAGTRFLIHRRLPSFLLVAPGNGPHRLAGYTHVAGYLPGRLSLAEFPQDQSPPQHPRRFPPLVQHPGDLLAILLG